VTARRRLTLYGIAAALVAIATVLWLELWTTGGLRHPKPPTAPVQRHPVDLVLVIDTTGSMGPILRAIRDGMWAIATHALITDPLIDLRVGLVAYRDVDDQYVTDDLALTEDLDAAYSRLASLLAAGGGDVPEDVDAALHDAVHQMRWRSDARKLVFLFGDAPPASRGDVPRFDTSVSDAAAQHIIINAIRYGIAEDTGYAWHQISGPTHGEFASLPEKPDRKRVTTQFDDELARLSHAIDMTAVIYGDSNIHFARAMHEVALTNATVAVQADRASYFAGLHNGGDRSLDDIVAQVDAGTLRLDVLSEAKLPDDLRGRSKQELVAEIHARALRRAELETQLEDLAHQRAEVARDHATDVELEAIVEAILDRELK
jgi:hypothetical protein